MSLGLLIRTKVYENMLDVWALPPWAPAPPLQRRATQQLEQLHNFLGGKTSLDWRNIINSWSLNNWWYNNILFEE